MSNGSSGSRCGYRARPPSRPTSERNSLTDAQLPICSAHAYPHLWAHGAFAHSLKRRSASWAPGLKEAAVWSSNPSSSKALTASSP